MKLRINRAKWLHGEGDYVSYLLRPADGKMCCLGFYGQALGVPTETLAYKKSPVGSEIFCKKAPWLGDTENFSEVCGDLMEVNDSCPDNQDKTRPVNIVLSEPEREARLTKLFAEHGVEVEFYG